MATLDETKQAKTNELAQEYADWIVRTIQDASLDTLGKHNADELQADLDDLDEIQDAIETLRALVETEQRLRQKASNE